MNFVIKTLARYMAIRAAKRELQRQGRIRSHIEPWIIAKAADDYLRSHPELLEEAAETVRNHPKLRTLAERYERKRRRIQR